MESSDCHKDNECDQIVVREEYKFQPLEERKSKDPISDEFVRNNYNILDNVNNNLQIQQNRNSSEYSMNKMQLGNNPTPSTSNNILEGASPMLNTQPQPTIETSKDFSDNLNAELEFNKSASSSCNLCNQNICEELQKLKVENKNLVNENLVLSETIKALKVVIQHKENVIYPNTIKFLEKRV